MSHICPNKNLGVDGNERELVVMGLVGLSWVWVVVGFVVAVVAIGIGVRLGCSGGWQWLAVGVGYAMG